MEASSFTILHEDAHLLFVAKPPKMLATPVPGVDDKGLSLEERLVAEKKKVIAVHRLDYETSGVIVFAKDEATAAALVELFRTRKVKKIYHAIVHGWLTPPQGEIDLPIRDLGAEAVISKSGSEAVTRYATIKISGPVSHMRIEIDTGRHNQIRLHFAHMGHPLVGERKYARGSEQIIRHSRVLLHSHQLSFQPPHLDHTLRITAPLPEDFEQKLLEAGEAKTRTAPRRIPPLKLAEGLGGPFGTNRTTKPAKTKHAGPQKSSASERRRAHGRGRSRPR